MNYYEFSFRIADPSILSEILPALLVEFGFESFLEEKDILKAYLPEKDFSADLPELIKHTIQFPDLKINYTFIQERNWNEEWERDYKPVFIDKSCMIHAPFHTPDESYPIHIVIEPKMSFGTAHHETTRLMCRYLLEAPLENKTVLDMGSGTAVLAILAAKRKASEVYAIDNDHWAYENSLLNIEHNNSKQVRVIHGDNNAIPNLKFDVLIANINKNILLQHVMAYSNAASENAYLYLSGFYISDLEDIKKAYKQAGFAFVDYREENKWVAARFIKS